MQNNKLFEFDQAELDQALYMYQKLLTEQVKESVIRQEPYLDDFVKNVDNNDTSAIRQEPYLEGFVNYAESSK